MKERYDLRLYERQAREWLAPDEGVALGPVPVTRKLVVFADDPVLDKVREAQAFYAARGGSLIGGWGIERLYTKKELDEAELFRLVPMSHVVVSAEERGTRYEAGSGCALCGTGEIQITPLSVNCRKLPKKDFWVMMGREKVVSRAFVDAVNSEDVKGAKFLPVLCGRDGEPSTEVFQLDVQDHDVVLNGATMMAARPFDPPFLSTGGCERGDLLGQNIISEAYVERSSWPNEDLAASAGFVGVRWSHFRPERLLFGTQRFRRAVESSRLSGLKLEVAHFV